MRTPNEIYDNELDLLGVTSMNEFDEAYLEFISEVQKEAWNEAIETVIKHAKTKEIKVYYTGVRAGGYTTKTVIDEESILKLKK